MMRFLKWAALALMLIAAAGLIYLQAVIVPRTDAKLNPVIRSAPYAVSDQAKALHAQLIVADLHADTLLWKRNPARRHDYGHTDLPRLREGNVALQVFSAVTKSPRGLNFDKNDGSGPDDITRLAMAQLWPPRTWGSLYERAAFQAQRLQKLERQSGGDFIIIRKGRDITDALTARQDNRQILMGLLETEGAHPLEGDLDNIARLYNEGYRMMGLQHFFDNELGGSMHGISQGGLSGFGREAVSEMIRQGIIIDVAHSSERVVRDVLALTDRPLVLSHGGVRSACPRTANRNLPDDILIEMAQRGSLIGIGYFEGVICDITPGGIADALIDAVALLGEDAVALGSDFDGTVTVSLDTSELAAITDALLRRGMDERVVAKVMGVNAVNFFTENLK